MNHHVPYRVTPATVDRIDEENASCVTARVMCPTGNNPEDS
jgi:L-lysine 2,3-aminomutase